MKDTSRDSKFMGAGTVIAAIVTSILAVIMVFLLNKF